MLISRLSCPSHPPPPHVITHMVFGEGYTPIKNCETNRFSDNRKVKYARPWECGGKNSGSITNESL
jgi:hypothetical protein